jgi:hypothetical protein
MRRYLRNALQCRVPARFQFPGDVAFGWIHQFVAPRGKSGIVAGSLEVASRAWHTAPSASAAFSAAIRAASTARLDTASSICAVTARSSRMPPIPMQSPAPT